MSRNLLHKSRVPEFLAWCEAKGIQTRTVTFSYQVAQIQPKGSKVWMSVYYRDHMPEHVTVDSRLEALVRNFIRSTREVKP
jgi:hypothetical protein